MNKFKKIAITASFILFLAVVYFYNNWEENPIRVVNLAGEFKLFDGLDTVKIAILQLLSVKSLMFFIAHAPHDDVFGVEFSPDFEKDRTIYSIVRGTFLKSIDAGNTWKRIVKGLDNRFELYSLESSAEDKNILFMSSLGDGIYKSKDRGNSWVKVNNGLETKSIDLVYISATSPDIAFAAGTESGFFQTKNGGESWSPILAENKRITAISSFFDQEQAQDYVVAGDSEGTLYFSQTGGDSWEKHLELIKDDEILDIKFSPDYLTDNTFFVATKSKGLFKTVDGGDSFSKISQGITDNSITSIFITKNDRYEIIIFISTWQQGIFYSQDQGNSWISCSKGLSKDKQADDAEFLRPHFSNLRLSPSFDRDHTIFVGGFDGLFKSVNGGKLWQKIDTLSPNIIVSLAVSPNYKQDSTVAISTYLGGGYISHDRGNNWSNINKGLLELKRYVKQGNLVRLFEVIFSPEYEKDNTIFSSSWRRFYASQNQGQDWHIQYFGPKRILKKLNLDKSPKSLIEPPLIVAVSPNYTIDRTIYLGTKIGDILQVVDGVALDKSIGNVGQRIYSLAMSPDFAQDRTIYAGAEDGIYESNDGGVTWRCLHHTATVTNLAISPQYTADGTILAGTAQNIYKTNDKGKNWHDLTDTPFGEDYYVEALVLSPTYEIDRTLLASIRGKGLFRSLDEGQTFTEIGQDLIDNNHLLSNYGSGYNCTSVPIKFSPDYANDKTIYGYSGLEVFRSQDGGMTWQSIFMPNYSNKKPINTLYRLVNVPLQLGGIPAKRD